MPYIITEYPICVTTASLLVARRALRVLLPDIGSRHLSEAMAQGFGFTKHASLLSTMTMTGFVRCMPDSLAFAGRLSELVLGGGVPPVVMEAAFRGVLHLADVPYLSHFLIPAIKGSFHKLTEWLTCQRPYEETLLDIHKMFPVMVMMDKLRVREIRITA